MLVAPHHIVSEILIFYLIVITFIFNSGFHIDKRRSDVIMNDVKRVSACISMEGIYNWLIPIIHRIFIFIYTTTNIFITIIIRSIRRRRQRTIRTIYRFGLFVWTTIYLVPVKSSSFFFLFAELHHETIRTTLTVMTDFHSSSLFVTQHMM